MSEHRITTALQLREIVGENHPGVDLKLFDALDEQMCEFVAKSPLVLISAANAAGHQQVSPKGDAPGFVEIEDPQTLLIPDRVGNRLVFGHTAILENPEVGLIFVLPGTGETLRVNGTAELTVEPELLERLSARGKSAQLVIRVRIRECFFHCAKAFLRGRVWDPDTWEERLRISFGRQIAPKLGLEDETARKIDENVEAGYSESEL